MPSTFPELEKICQIEVKFWFFFKLQLVVLKWNVFCVCEILFNLTCMSWKKLRSCRGFFKLSIDHLFLNLESGKRNYCFGKSPQKVLNFGSKICTNPVLMFQRKKAMHLSPLGPKSDHQQFPPNNIGRSSRVKVMRISKMITKGKMLWSFIKFSQLIL